MMEWGVTPEYINNRWTEELLTLMFMKRTKRIKRLNTAQEKQQLTSGVPPVQYNKQLTKNETDVFAALSIVPEVVRVNRTG